MCQIDFYTSVSSLFLLTHSPCSLSDVNPMSATDTPHYISFCNRQAPQEHRLFHPILCHWNTICPNIWRWYAERYSFGPGGLFEPQLAVLYTIIYNVHLLCRFVCIQLAIFSIPSPKYEQLELFSGQDSKVLVFFYVPSCFEPLVICLALSIWIHWWLRGKKRRASIGVTTTIWGTTVTKFNFSSEDNDYKQWTGGS